MRRVQTVEDVYPAIDELIVEAGAAGHARLATILHDRMYQAVWTAGSELIEELQDVLTQALESDGPKLPDSLKQQMKQVLLVIDSFLRAPEG